MARPKTIKEGGKLNLYIPKSAKRLLFAAATKRGMSMSAVVTDLIFKASAKPTPNV